MTAIIEARDTTNEIECLAGPPTHGLIPLPQTIIQDQLSDYDTASSISSTSIEPCAKTNKTFGCSISIQTLKKSMKVKKKYLPSKLAYYTVYSSRAIFATYFIIFLTSTGLDPEQAGQIQGVRMVVLTLSSVFWGVLAEQSKKSHLIMTINLCSFGMFVFAKPWVAHWIGYIETREQHREHIEEAVMDILKQHSNYTKSLIHIMDNSNKNITEIYNLQWKASHYQSGSTPLFVSMLGLGIVSAFLGGGLQILLDTRVIYISKTLSKNKNTYGRQRLWGSVAYSITPVICGIILESVPVSSVSPIMPVFYLHLTAIFASVISCHFLFRQNIPDEQQINQTPEQNLNESIGIMQLLRKIVKDPHVIVLFVNVLLMGFGNGLQWCFMFLYMQELKSSKTVIGLSVMSQCGTEAIMFSFASKAIQKLGSTKIAITVGIFGYAIAFSMFSALDISEPFIAVTTILGVSYTLFYCASMEDLYRIGNPKCMTSLYALYNSILCGLGNGLAGIVGGAIYKNYGAKNLFFYASIFFTISGVGNVLYNLFHYKLQKNIMKTTSINHGGDQGYKKFLDLKTLHPRRNSDDDDAISLPNHDNVI